MPSVLIHFHFRYQEFKIQKFLTSLPISERNPVSNKAFVCSHRKVNLLPTSYENVIYCIRRNGSFPNWWRSLTLNFAEFPQDMESRDQSGDCYFFSTNFFLRLLKHSAGFPVLPQIKFLSQYRKEASISSRHETMQLI